MSFFKALCCCSDTQVHQLQGILIDKTQAVPPKNTAPETELKGLGRLNSHHDNRYLYRTLAFAGVALLLAGLAAAILFAPPVAVAVAAIPLMTPVIGASIVGGLATIAAIMSIHYGCKHSSIQRP